MKKFFACLLAMCLLLAGCSSGVSQEEYDKVVSERDAALSKLSHGEPQEQTDSALNVSDVQNGIELAFNSAYTYRVDESIIPGYEYDITIDLSYGRIDANSTDEKKEYIERFNNDFENIRKSFSDMSVSGITVRFNQIMALSGQRDSSGQWGNDVAVNSPNGISVFIGDKEYEEAINEFYKL